VPPYQVLRLVAELIIQQDLGPPHLSLHNGLLQLSGKPLDLSLGRSLSQHTQDDQQRCARSALGQSAACCGMYIIAVTCIGSLARSPHFTAGYRLCTRTEPAPTKDAAMRALSLCSCLSSSVCRAAVSRAAKLDRRSLSFSADRSCRSMSNAAPHYEQSHITRRTKVGYRATRPGVQT
jgi:hypothetical protein